MKLLNHIIVPTKTPWSSIVLSCLVLTALRFNNINNCIDWIIQSLWLHVLPFVIKKAGQLDAIRVICSNTVNQFNAFVEYFFGARFVI